jgi:hypothetical protein
VQEGVGHGVLLTIPVSAHETVSVARSVEASGSLAMSRQGFLSGDVVKPQEC